MTMAPTITFAFQRRLYTIAERRTRLDDAVMPSGRWTCQWRSFSSTQSTTVASDGGWSIGVVKSRKSGPSWATGSEFH